MILVSMSKYKRVQSLYAFPQHLLAEVDRITPYAAVIQQTPEDLLDDLSVERLLLREDLIPPVPDDEDIG